MSDWLKVAKKSAGATFDRDLFRSGGGPARVRRQHDDFLRLDAVRHQRFR